MEVLFNVGSTPTNNTNPNENRKRLLLNMIINLQNIKRILNERGWYSLAIRLDKPEYRNEKYKGEWTDDSLTEYLNLHCGEDETKIILGENIKV